MPVEPGSTRRKVARGPEADAGFDHHEIATRLPHRYPFQFVDRVLVVEAGRRLIGLKNLSLNEPFFRGHFPDNPVMPGVLICEALAQAGALLLRSSSGCLPHGRTVALTGLDRVRFRKPVVPGDRLELDVSIMRHHAPLWRLRGVARVDETVVAEAELLLSEIDEAASRA